MKFTIILLISLSFLANPAIAGEGREIELNDGSVIFGEIVTLEGNIYTIKTKGLGTVRVEKSKIQSIRPRSDAETERAQLKDIEQRMLNDDDIRTLLLALERDPEFKEILEDPEIMERVHAGDISGLLSNPNFMKLLDNPTVHEIRRQIEE